MGLTSQYENPASEGSLGGVQRFAQAQRIKPKDAQETLQKILSYTLHKPRRKKFPTLPVVVYAIDSQWCADLIEVQTLKRWNKGTRYLLTVIDVLSKHAWVQPMRDKTGKSVVLAFQKIFKGGRQPQRLQTDAGKEFYNKVFQAFLKKKNIHHFSTHGDTKSSVSERFNRTLKDRKYRWFTASNQLCYTNVLQDLVKSYNNSKHRSIGMTPNQVTAKNEKRVWLNLYGKKLKEWKKPKLKVGDRVRLNKKHRPFKKSYLPGWTEEVFLIREAKPGPVATYKVSEYDETPIEGTHSNKAEFSTNANNSFKIRLPQPLILHGSGWSVGLVSVSLPDIQVELLMDQTYGNPLVVTRIGEYTSSPKVLDYSLEAMVNWNQIDSTVRDSQLFMGSLFDKIMTSMVESYSGGKYSVYENKRLYPDFVWVEKYHQWQLKVLYQDVHSKLLGKLFLKLNLKLAKLAKWVTDTGPDKYKLGPNLRYEFFPDNAHPMASLWVVENDELQLSNFCNWVFLNTQTCLNDLFSHPQRTLQVYSNVGESHVVGNQVTDLLREIQYKVKGRGSVYFEPLHIQYVNVRQTHYDVIETQIAETSGSLAKLGSGNTIVTLHFKQV
ncbi:hypothetical protein ACROYT_G014457 [Oculina patagonica]